MTGRLVQAPGPTDAPGSVCGEPSADFDGMLKSLGLPPLRRRRVRSLQLNVTTRCNLACHHCHVESGPKRTESMDRRTAERVLELLAENPQLESLDLTGGAPELCAHFRLLVRGARDLGRRVLDRCNLTVLFEAGQEQTAEYLAEQEPSASIVRSASRRSQGNPKLPLAHLLGAAHVLFPPFSDPSRLT